MLLHLNYLYGSYRIREVSVGNNEYILNEQNKTLEIKKDEITKITIENKHKQGNLIIYKVDKDNNKIGLGNVEFDLYSEEFDKVVGTYYTDINGLIKLYNIRTGNYKLLEKNSGTWYNLAEDTEVKVEWDTTINTTIENELKKGQVKIIKVDEENNEIKLENVEFQVLDKEGKVLETVKTNSVGEAMTSKYSVRDYEKIYLKEISTNENYVLSDELIEVKLIANDISEITITNKVKTGKIRVIKVDKDNNKIVIPNVTFEVIDNNTNKVVDIIKTNEKGIAITKDLKITSTYSLKEISNADITYNLNTDIIETNVKYNEIKNVIITNEKKKGQIQIEKVDEDFNEIKLENVEFEIINSEDKIVDKIKTDKNRYCYYIFDSYWKLSHT